MVHTSSSERMALLREGVLFLAAFGVSAGVLYLLLRPIEITLQTLLSAHTQRVLEILGTRIVAQSPIRFWAETHLIEVSPLCAGLLEMILLTSAIIATRDVNVQKKLQGIVAGVAALYVFNLLRIVFTVQQIVHTPYSFAELTHDVLFRLVLIVGFAAIYYVWLNWNNVRLHLFRI